MGFVRGIIGLALAILFAVFAVANRQGVEIIWSPVHAAFPVPLYVVALGMLALGFFIGSLMTWLYALPKNWTKGHRIKALEKELGAAKKSEKIPAKTQDWTALPVKSTE